MEYNVFLKKYTTHLNENQLKAVQTVDGPVLLLAVPGSGKTTVLVTRLGYANEYFDCQSHRYEGYVYQRPF